MKEDRTGPYENGILRGLQEALETDSHGAKLIEEARRAKAAERKGVMPSVIRELRAEPTTGILDDEMASLIKGMLRRGDKQSDIAACFMINSGRIAEINHMQRFAHIGAAPDDRLPPIGPYPSPYELWKAKKELWRTRVALERAQENIQEAMVAIHKAEQR